MPSTVIGNATWNSTGLVLSQQSAQEQTTGLVNVQLTYVCPASKQHALARNFYLDAPPPIFPSVVSRAELLTNNLYMVNRSVQTANGLCTITADYAGGLRRAGFVGYFLYESIELKKQLDAYSIFSGPDFITEKVEDTQDTIERIKVGPNDFIEVVRPSLITRYINKNNQFAYTFVKDSTGALRRVSSDPLEVRFDETIKEVIFVRIGNEQATSLPNFYRNDLVAIARVQRKFGGAAASAASALGADLWIVGDSAYSPETPVPAVETAQYITPRVKIITRTHRLTS
jgi:hypothetical protein